MKVLEATGLIFVAMAFALPSQSFAQDQVPPGVSVSGSHDLDPEALQVIMSYAMAAQQHFDTVEERDARRAEYVAPGYFYHGIDGHPIGFQGLTTRQTDNGLEAPVKREIFDVTIHQYENTALMTYKTWSVVKDRGAMQERLGSNLMVLTKTSEGWRVVSDFLGVQPSEKHIPEAIRTMRSEYLATEVVSEE
ncbi:hypothetical protein [Sphingomicrobium arenosum]|uniref:hypothetical protein n=1 Tax=Sphingomicrobium arenosum TaxID=2233861 RepID=UPI00223F425A|nr:hypothetical protein [Sphingomicrobium arenosum]